MEQLTEKLLMRHITRHFLFLPMHQESMIRMNLPGLAVFGSSRLNPHLITLQRHSLMGQSTLHLGLRLRIRKAPYQDVMG
jgi:hypothetical protein